MPNAITTQEATTEGHSNNTGAFRAAYKRLNGGEQKEIQAAFCLRFHVSPAAFRARVAGHTRTSDTELAWMEEQMAKYFPAKL